MFGQYNYAKREDFVGLGQGIRKLREEAGLTQRKLCDATGLAVSYLSRVENERITPSIPTLNKISAALEVPMTAFFGQSVPPAAKDETCPVSLTGKCILDLAHVRRRVIGSSRAETYSDEQLGILMECNYLIHSGRPEILSTLSTVMKALLALIPPDKKSGERALPFLGVDI